MSRDNLDDAKMHSMTGARWVDIDGDRLAIAIGSETGQNGALALANLNNLGT